MELRIFNMFQFSSVYGSCTICAYIQMPVYNFIFLLEKVDNRHTYIEHTSICHLHTYIFVLRRVFQEYVQFSNSIENSDVWIFCTRCKRHEALGNLELYYIHPFKIQIQGPKTQNVSKNRYCICIPIAYFHIPPTVALSSVPMLNLKEIFCERKMAPSYLSV
jgi:hypothetical protein